MCLWLKWHTVPCEHIPSVLRPTIWLKVLSCKPFVKQSKMSKRLPKYKQNIRGLFKQSCETVDLLPWARKKLSHVHKFCSENRVRPLHFKPRHHSMQSFHIPWVFPNFLKLQPQNTMYLNENLLDKLSESLQCAKSHLRNKATCRQCSGQIGPKLNCLDYTQTHQR